MIGTESSLFAQIHEGFHFEDLTLKDKWYLLRCLTENLTEASPGEIQRRTRGIATQLSNELSSNEQEEVILEMVSQIRDM